MGLGRCVWRGVFCHVLTGMFGEVCCLFAGVFEDACLGVFEEVCFDSCVWRGML